MNIAKVNKKVLFKDNFQSDLKAPKIQCHLFAIDVVDSVQPFRMRLKKVR